MYMLMGSHEAYSTDGRTSIGSCRWQIMCEQTDILNDRHYWNTRQLSECRAL